MVRRAWLAQCILSIFFVKQKTSYEMRISDWSSDVCSSDLPEDIEGRHDDERVADIVRIERGLDGNGKLARGHDGAAVRRQQAIAIESPARCAVCRPERLHRRGARKHGRARKNQEINVEPIVGGRENSASHAHSVSNTDRKS